MIRAILSTFYSAVCMMYSHIQHSAQTMSVGLSAGDRYSVREELSSERGERLCMALHYKCAVQSLYGSSLLQHQTRVYNRLRTSRPGLLVYI